MDNQISASDTIQLQYGFDANWLNELAVAIKTYYKQNPVITDNILLLPAESGGGSIRHWEIGENITVVHWDCRLSQPVMFIPESRDQCYSICCFYSYEHLSAGEDRSFTAFYDTTPAALQQALNSGRKVKAIWLLIRKSYFDELLLRQANDKEQNTFIVQTFLRKTLINKNILVALTEFFDLTERKMLDNLSTKGKIFGLVSLFLELYINKKQDKKRYLTDVEQLMALNRSMEEKCFEDLLTVPQMADALHISVTKFKQLFTEVYDNTYLQYHIYHRLLIAQEMLRQPKIRMGEIALKAGYSGISHFTKAYKKHFGNTPAEYHNEYMRMTESII